MENVTKILRNFRYKVLFRKLRKTIFFRAKTLLETVEKGLGVGSRSLVECESRVPVRREDFRDGVDVRRRSEHTQ